jgi:hypothetical protein
MKPIHPEQARTGIVFATSTDLYDFIKEKLGDAPYWAHYNFTPEYSDIALWLDNPDDDVEVTRPGIEVVIPSFYHTTRSNISNQRRTFSLHVKDTSDAGIYTHHFYEHLQLWFPTARLSGFVQKNDLHYTKARIIINMNELPRRKFGKNLPYRKPPELL